jgi:hypothetical protein
MVQSETMKLLSLSYVDFRTGPKAQGPTRPQPADGIWAGNNTDMPILGICIKKRGLSQYQLSVEIDTDCEKLASFRHGIESYKPTNEEFHS